MSEYQYYEFQAIDRRLTAREMATLRGYSTRARITPASFVNDYQWDDCKGNEDAWMEKHFDAFLYLANWGTHVFKLRLPARLLDLKTARRYCAGDCAAAREKNGSVILTFLSEDEEAGDWEEGDGRLSGLISVRADLACGDLRSLYLGWLLCAQAGDLKDEETEPPVPPGLAQLSATLESLMAFLRIDSDLVAAAAAASPPLGNAVRKRAGDRGAGTTAAKRRTVAELLRGAEQAAGERRRIAAEKAENQKVRRENAAAKARAKYLDELAGKDHVLWEKVEGLIATKQPASYDRAVQLLADLRDLAARGDGADFRRRMEPLRAVNARKPALIGRFQKAEL